MVSECPVCSSPWERVSLDGYYCRLCDRTFARDELAGRPVDRSVENDTAKPPDPPFPIPKWTSLPLPPDRVRGVLHVLSSFFHERNERNELTGFEAVREELLDYLQALGFFENEAGELVRPHEFLDTFEAGPILAGLKFSLYQRDIVNPGGYLRNLVVAGDTGQLHPFIRKRLLGYVPRFDRWLCPEEADLLRRWATYDGGRTAAATRAELVPADRSRHLVIQSAKGRRTSRTGCDCHDSFNEAYFRDHLVASNGASSSWVADPGTDEATNETGEPA